MIDGIGSAVKNARGRMFSKSTLQDGSFVCFQNKNIHHSYSRSTSLSRNWMAGNNDIAYFLGLRAVFCSFTSFIAAMFGHLR